MTKRFLDLLDSAECDDRVRCVLLTGSGKMFCLGVDMDHLEMLEDRHGRPFYYARLVPKPVICALNGSAAGIGLALACMLVLLLLLFSFYTHLLTSCTHTHTHT